MIQLESTSAPRFSCACLMIVGDVEPTIRSCMDSVLFSGCFDQYVIIQDARTSDATPEILENYRKAHPEIRLAWHDWRSQDYAKARNRGLELTSCQYGFWIDGDEILLDAGGIFRTLQNPGGRAFHIWQVGPDPFGRIVQTHQLRLFPILTGVKWELPVHEQLVFSIRRLGIPEEITPYRVWHFGYQSEEANARKHRRYSEIMRAWLTRGNRPKPHKRYLDEQYQSSMSYIRTHR
jgi:glycosyltransferase involved in cell wall biosynthesis